MWIDDAGIAVKVHGTRITDGDPVPHVSVIDHHVISPPAAHILEDSTPGIQSKIEFAAHFGPHPPTLRVVGSGMFAAIRSE